MEPSSASGGGSSPKSPKRTALAAPDPTTSKRSLDFGEDGEARLPPSSKEVHFESELTTTKSGVILGDEFGTLRSVGVHDKIKTVCQRSLYIFGLDNFFRQIVIAIVEWKWFDRFILFCILINSVLLGIYPYRAVKGEDHYVMTEIIDGPADLILWSVFALESVLKIVAWGFVLDKHSFLRDPWNVLDFIVVVSGLLERFELNMDIKFLRLFRLLRPLRSLNAAPQMKVLVNTALSSVLRLGNVFVLGAFLFTVFGIVGISMMPGVMYRQCRTAENPVLTAGENGTDKCWSWPEAGDGRLCGGNYMCEVSDGHCGGHPEEMLDLKLRPEFDGRTFEDGGMRGYGWCDGSAPKKVFPETDFVHFDHIGGAYLLIFQSMTLEGWTELLYMIEDSYSPLFAVVFFVSIVVLTNMFMLNVALAVVDEVQDQFTEEAEERKRITMEEMAASGETPVDEDDSEEGSDVLWWDCKLVRCCKTIADQELFGDFIMLIIAGNVVNMCLSRFSLDDSFGWAGVEHAIQILERLFLGIFIVEMFIVVLAVGPKRYVKNPITCFDGIVVAGSILEQIINFIADDGGGGFLSVLRTSRLFRVLNKLANKWTKLKVLLKAMYHTGSALKDWLILFCLVLYIFTLMCMHAFSMQFRFKDADAVEVLYPLVDQQHWGDAWCPGPYDGTTWNFQQDCIPRANFDTFGWGIVTVFQVMSGENWNTIMYAGMRASERWTGSLAFNQALAALLFVAMILLGQSLFMSLFISMLISKFDEVQDECQKEEEAKEAAKRASLVNRSTMSLSGLATLARSKVMFTKVRQDKDESKKLFDHNSNSPRHLAAPGRTSPDSTGSQIPSDSEKARAALSKDNSDTTLASESHREVGPPNREAGAHTMPGQLPHTPVADDQEGSLGADQVPVPMAPVASKPAPQDDDTDDDKTNGEALAAPWPKGYTLYIFSPRNPIRRACHGLLEKRVCIRGEKIAVFDNFILACIILSTICMMSTTPLSNPHDVSTKIFKVADTTFAIIFIVEMSVKLTAQGLWMGKDAYLCSPWNWLDGCVVIVSIVDLLPMKGGPGFLRALRILRTFRPLRVVSRLEGLKVVVQTLFQSVGDLLGLAIASFLFLLIFALVCVLNLQGNFYACTPADGADVGFLGSRFGQLGDNFVTPLCVSSEVINGTAAMGTFSKETGVFTSHTSCPANLPNEWQRASADTPICLARCDPTLDSHSPEIEHLCHRKYRNAMELPAVCPAGPVPRTPLYAEQEAIGNTYIADMKRTLVVPCGGYSANGQAVELTAASASCSKNFCPQIGPPTKECVSECKDHKFFCKESCKGDKKGSVECLACRGECEAACMCEDFCTPLILDAALCVEQGGTWDAVLSQNFNNIWNALLALFEIMTTEGWVDVMYAAADATEQYRQPVRDSNLVLPLILFPLWIVLSFMFLLNLVIGVVVDNFADAKKDGTEMMVTPEQKEELKRFKKWSQGRKLLLLQENVHFILRDLDKMNPVRVSVYHLVSSKIFENTIMACIILNTVVMALAYFPKPTLWWVPLQEAANLVFACIFAVEAALKLFAIRLNYFNDPWNQFDFVCVLASIVGIVSGAGPLVSVIRIVRIARLFRLLRFLKELNRLFRCLFRSIPKLMNVLMMLSLVLVLFSILGMSLFGTAKFNGDGCFNEHGNFRTFLRGFVTLLRASTGEAWNEIMHDLAKTERDWFREGDWCTPQSMWRDAADDSKVWDVMEEKCLIADPNACGGSWNPLTYFFWVSYTIVTLVMMLNVVVAVILEGYEEGRQSSEEDNLEACVDIWRKYDPNHKLVIPLKDALVFINEVETKLLKKKHVDTGDDTQMSLWERETANIAASKTLGDLASRMRLKDSRRKWRLMVTEDEKVSFHSAAKMILRLNMVEDGEDTEEALMKLDESENLAPKKASQINELERLRSENGGCRDLITYIAAVKVQRKFRARQRILLQTAREQVVEIQSPR